MEDEKEAGQLYQEASARFSRYAYLDALPLFSRAAELGHPGAIRQMGWFFENGYGVPADLNKAAELYQQAVEAGDGIAAGHLGILWDSVTKGFPTDEARAVQLYTLALDRGCASATVKNNLAVLCMEGRGREPDLNMAERLYLEAINQGCRLARCNYQVLIQRLTACPRCGSRDLENGTCRVCGYGKF